MIIDQKRVTRQAGNTYAYCHYGQKNGVARGEAAGQASRREGA